MKRGWNPKRLGIVKSNNSPYETEVWLYLKGRTLDIVIQVNYQGRVLGQTIHKIMLPPSPRGRRP